MIIQPYQKNDEAAILALFPQCFGKQMREQFWRWRFIENPIKQIFIMLAWDDDKLAAHYAVSPVLMTLNKKEFLTSLSMTTMTHPQYRGLKLFSRLANQVYDLLAEENHLMVWGFPNIMSHRMFMRDLSWKNLYEIPTMQLKIDPAGDIDDSTCATDNQFQLNYIDGKYSSNQIHVKKDNRYLRWRYSEHPINHYTNFVISNEQDVTSFCVVKKYLNVLDIVDFQASALEEGEFLIAKAISFSRKNNLKFINCWAPRHHFVHFICQKHGFVNKEPITYSGFRQLSNVDHIKVSEIFSDWYVQMGDSDVY